jgi:hypothetical protein
MAESNDYKTFKKNVPQLGDRLDRIENAVVTGMPDINFCSGGVECWVELKSPKEPVRTTTRLFGSNHRVSQEQANWMLRQRRAGGRCYVLIATDKRWILIGGGLADQINDMTVDQLIDNAVWHTNKPVKEKEQWKHLRNALRRSN